MEAHGGAADLEDNQKTVWGWRGADGLGGGAVAVLLGLPWAGEPVVCVVKSEAQLQLRPALRARRAGTFPALGPAARSCCPGHGAAGHKIFCISAPSLSANICALAVD